MQLHLLSSSWPLISPRGWAAVSILVGLFACCAKDRAAEPAKEAVPSLSPELMAAWNKAGAEVGWMAVGRNGFKVWNEWHPDIKGKKGQVPAFRFSDWKVGIVGNLPQPQQPFGLDLGTSGITDAGLKEVAELKNLHSLCLAG